MIQDTTTMDLKIERPRVLRRSVVLAAALVVVLAGGVIVLSPSLRRWARSETSVELSRIRLGQVSRGDLVREVSVDGRIVAACHPTLYSPARGIVTLAVLAGEEISQGQRLAQVESPELSSRLEQERSSLLALQADLERQRIQVEQALLQHQQAIDLLEVELQAAQRAMDRAERSRQLGIVNAVEYEKAQDNVQVAELALAHARQLRSFAEASVGFEVRDRSSQVERQRLLVTELRRQVAALEITSPVQGIVSRLHIEDRQAVAEHMPLITVVDLSAFEVEVGIAESQASEIVAGTEAEITCDGARYPALVRAISPEVEGSRVKGIVAFADAVPAGLRQHQRVQTRLILGRSENVLKVPRGPFLESDGGRRVYLVEQGLAVLHPIEIGALSLSEVEIVAGLELGQQIIVSDTTRFEGAATVLLRR